MEKTEPRVSCWLHVDAAPYYIQLRGESECHMPYHQGTRLSDDYCVSTSSVELEDMAYWCTAHAAAPTVANPGRDISSFVVSCHTSKGVNIRRTTAMRDICSASSPGAASSSGTEGPD